MYMTPQTKTIVEIAAKEEAERKLDQQIKDAASAAVRQELKPLLDRLERLEGLVGELQRSMPG